MAASINSDFIERSRAYLSEEYLPKICQCLERLSEDQVWWRPNESSNSVGNLMLHLAGNARQWIVSGVVGAPDVRRRREEFDRREPLPKVEVLRVLSEAVAEVDRTLADVDPDALVEPRHIQGYDVTVFEAIYHVVEHFSMHTGQIAYLTKGLTGEDLGFYRLEAEGVAKPNW